MSAAGPFLGRFWRLASAWYQNGHPVEELMPGIDGIALDLRASQTT